MKGTTKVGNKWRTRTQVNGTTTHIGLFETEAQGHAAYDKFIAQHAVDTEPRLVYGIGTYNSQEPSTNNPCYESWKRMLKQVSQGNATMVPHWERYSMYAMWYERNRAAFYRGHKLCVSASGREDCHYSEYDIAPLPRDLHALLSDNSPSDRELPLGVSKARTKGKLIANIKVNDKYEHLGTFDSAFDASIAVRRARQSAFRRLALAYALEGEISDEVYAIISKRHWS